MKSRIWKYLCFKANPKDAGYVPNDLDDEITRLKGLGYSLVSKEDGVVFMKKFKIPPLSFLLYFRVHLIVPLIMNVFWGYRFRARIYEKDGRIYSELI